jgi:S-adenosylmethionine synthetase
MYRHAEDVLPGHPDRVCDGIAEAIVTQALHLDPEALVGVEVALHRHLVCITGRVAASEVPGTSTSTRDAFDQSSLERLVAEQFHAAGYHDVWEHPVRVMTDLDVGPLLDDERAIRRYSDDQGIATGYATPHTPDLLPLEQTVARSIRRALAAARAEHADVLGPDGKVLVRLAAPRSIGAVNVAIQHVAGVGFADLYDMVVPHLTAAIDALEGTVEPPARFDGDALRLNGIGDFTCGGPLGDNGLSGKKLVVDHYGPHVPIGGGAICGKDAHKPDRVGAVRARQLAVRLARATGDTALVHLGWLPGLEAPDRCWATLGDGTPLDRAAIEALVHVPDLSLAGTATDLELAHVDWPTVMRAGYLGNDRPWDR